ncbi:MAG: hypothetical protein ACRD6X_11030 [Pyrinomonadaceae bacterium]
MKLCSKCGTNYSDDTLRFCLQDGNPLADAVEEPTVVRSGRDPNKTEELPSNLTARQNEGVRVTIPTAENSQYSPSIQPAKSRSALWVVLIAALALGGVVVIAAAGIVGYAYYRNSGNRDIVLNSPTPQPSPTATPDNDKQKLQDEIANLKKKLGDTSNSNSDADVSIDEEDFNFFGKTATVNSPQDGFLALRNLPSSDIGNRIAKIPHGTTVKIFMCSDQKATIAGRTGHWCMITYNDQTGWVFDVWLTFATDSKN